MFCPCFGAYEVINFAIGKKEQESYSLQQYIQTYPLDHETDLVRQGLHFLSSSMHIMPMWEGSSKSSLATKQPEMDHVCSFRACLPIVRPNFPSQYSGHSSLASLLSASSIARLAICGLPAFMQAAVIIHKNTARVPGARISITMSGQGSMLLAIVQAS